MKRTRRVFLRRMDGSEFRGIEAPEITVRDGRATVAGLPGLGLRLRDKHLKAPSLVLEA